MEKLKLKNLVEYHLKLHQNLRIQDVYKMLYQANMGLSHFMDNYSEAEKYLQDEYNKIDIDTDDLLLEKLSIDEKIYRINLKPFKKQELSVDLLFKTIKKSAEILKANPDELKKQWDYFCELVKEKNLEFKKNELLDFDKKIKEKNYPILSHSEKYRKANAPSYRIVCIRTFYEIFSKDLNKIFSG